MPIEIDIKLDKKTLSHFLIYHNYFRASGVTGLVLSVAAVAALCLKWDMWTPSQRCLLVVLALLFTVVQPLILIHKGRRQLREDEFQDSFHYRFDNAGVTISQREQKQSFPWKEIRKIVYRKNVIYVYMSTISAFVIPREQCEKDFDSLIRLMNEKQEIGI